MAGAKDRDASCTPPISSRNIMGQKKAETDRRKAARHTRNTQGDAMAASVTCPYCGGSAQFVRNSAEFYHGRDFGPLYVCRPCDARVGCHPGTEKPLGRLANAELRAAKMRAHAAFDPLWKRKAALGKNRYQRKAARSLGYRWLAGQLGIDHKECHIGMFDVETCNRVVEVVRSAVSARR